MFSGDTWPASIFLNRFKKITEVKKQFNLEFSNVKNINQLEKLDNKFLSRKGILANLFSQIANIDDLDRPKAGSELNSLKIFISNEIATFKESIIDSSKINSPSIDYSLPGKKINIGSKRGSW